VSLSQPPTTRVADTPINHAHAPSGARAAVQLTSVSRLFGRFAALREVTATFQSARIYLILGDNGAGKSTLLRVIAGLIRPSSGQLAIYGESELHRMATQFGYMAHAPLLYDEMDAMENLRYVACLYGLKGDAVCRKAIEAVGLDPELKRRVGNYSQGMRQRLSLARAMLHDPALLLLDEPFSNVDAVSARHMVTLLGEMRDAGKTIFVVTHQPALLEGVADESVWMSAGRIVGREPGVALPSISTAVTR